MIDSNNSSNTETKISESNTEKKISMEEWFNRYSEKKEKNYNGVVKFVKDNWVNIKKSIENGYSKATIYNDLVTDKIITCSITRFYAVISEIEKEEKKEGKKEKKNTKLKEEGKNEETTEKEANGESK